MSKFMLFITKEKDRSTTEKNPINTHSGLIKQTMSSLDN